MGTWGPGLFSDDIACDVRDSYRDLVGDGHTGPQATEVLLKDWAPQLDDPDDGPVFWLSLAATQLRCGRLEDRVKAKALEIIEAGTDLNRWKDAPRALRNRQSVLDRLAEELRSPQPAPKRIPKRFRDSTDWTVGEVIAYRLMSGNLVLLRVIGFHTDWGGTGPVVEPLDWIGREIPDKPTIQRLRLKARRIVGDGFGHNQFLLGRVGGRELPQDRVVRTGIVLEPSQAMGRFAVFLWRYLDRQLEEDYGVV